VPPIDFNSALQQKQEKDHRKRKNSPNPNLKKYQEDNFNPSSSISNRKQETKESSICSSKNYKKNDGEE
jgi:hypothetical protein